MPINFLLTLTIPVVDFTEPLNNWNKWLNVIHCFISPIFASIVTESKYDACTILLWSYIFLVGLYKLGNSDVPAVVLFAFAGLILAIIVAMTSYSHKPPIYHCVRYITYIVVHALYCITGVCMGWFCALCYMDICHCK